MGVLAYAGSPRNFLERVTNLLEKVDYRLALTDSDLDSVYQLRYDAYIREGAIRPTFSQRFSDKYDDAENCLIFGIYLGGELASSIRLHIANAAFPILPALTVFSETLEPELAAGKTIIDPTRFVIEQRHSRLFPELRYATVRLAWVACEYFNADKLLATVRTEHQAFYRRVFGHQVLCPARPYPSLDKPISLMNVDYHEAKAGVNGRYPFFRSTFFERRMLFERLGGEQAARTVRPETEPTIAAEPVRLVR